MPKSNAQTLQTDWSSRISQFKQLGLPEKDWQQLAQTDFTNVLNNGQSPMSSSYVNAAMLALSQGKSEVGNPAPKSHGILSDIGHTIESIPSDTRDILSNFLGGTANFIHHLPSEVTGTAELWKALASGDGDWLTSHGYEDPSHEDFWQSFLTSIRDQAKAPLLGALTPGLEDISNLTTSAGRQSLMQHPVGALLDAMPGSAGGALSRSAEKVGLLDQAAAGSAREALNRGNAGRAAARGILQVTEKVPKLKDRPLATRGGWQKMADTLGISERYKSIVNRPYSVLKRVGGTKMVEYADALGHDVMNLTDQEQKDLYEFAVLGTKDTTQIDPKLIGLAEQVKDIQENLLEHGTKEFVMSKGEDGLLTVPYGEGRLPFSAQSPLATHFLRVQKLSRLLDFRKKRRDALVHKLADYQHKAAELSYRRGGENNRYHELYNGAKLRLMKAEVLYRRTEADLHDTQASGLDALLDQTGVAAIQPRIRHDVKEGVQNNLRGQARRSRLHTRHLLQRHHIDAQTFNARIAYNLEQLNTSLDTVSKATRIDQLEDALGGTTYTPNSGETKAQAEANRQLNLTRGKQRFDDLKRDVTRNVLDLVAHGWDPIWVHHVDPGMARYDLNITVLPDHIKDVGHWQDVVFNFAPSAEHVGLGLLEAARQYFSHQATKQYVNLLVTHFGESFSDLWDKYMKIAEGELRGGTPGKAASVVEGTRISARATELLNKDYDEIKPESYGLISFTKPTSPRDKVMVPKELSGIMRQMTKPAYQGRALPLLGAYDKTIHVFKFSVLTGPRHLVHVAVGGTTALMLREPFAPRQFHRAISLLKNHPDSIPPELAQHLYHYQTDQILMKAAGGTLGRWLRTAWQHSGQVVEHRLMWLESWASNILRTSAFLEAGKRMDINSALAIANKTFVDMDDMAPFERTIIKHIFPFYAFTKYLFRYLLTYPTDHPYRVSILSAFAEQEQADWNSLLPQKFQQLLWIGKPNADGNVLTIDYKNANPFRSFSNDMTMAGFFQSLNPILSAPFAARGFDTLTGVGDLYPQVEFNPTTGSLTAQPPGLTDETFNVLEQFVPEVGAIDHFVGITSEMKRLKQSGNQSAYRALLFSQLNVPFAPVTVNVPYTESKTEIARYKAASSALTAYEQTGSDQDLNQFSMVPYQGRYLSPEEFESYWNGLVNQIRATGSDVNPKALVTSPNTRTSTDPYSLLGETGPGQQEK